MHTEERKLEYYEHQEEKKTIHGWLSLYEDIIWKIYQRSNLPPLKMNITNTLTWVTAAHEYALLVPTNAYQDIQAAPSEIFIGLSINVNGVQNSTSSYSRISPTSASWIYHKNAGDKFKDEYMMFVFSIYRVIHILGAL